eukprot:Filipodium_phascolosomae@DN1930_c0_g1_i2.p1
MKNISNILLLVLGVAAALVACVCADGGDDKEMVEKNCFKLEKTLFCKSDPGDPYDIGNELRKAEGFWHEIYDKKNTLQLAFVCVKLNIGGHKYLRAVRAHPTRRADLLEDFLVAKTVLESAFKRDARGKREAKRDSIQQWHSCYESLEESTDIFLLDSIWDLWNPQALSLSPVEILTDNQIRKINDRQYLALKEPYIGTKVNQFLIETIDPLWVSQEVDINNINKSKDLTNTEKTKLVQNIQEDLYLDIYFKEQIELAKKLQSVAESVPKIKASDNWTERLNIYNFEVHCFREDSPTGEYEGGANVALMPWIPYWGPDKLLSRDSALKDVDLWAKAIRPMLTKGEITRFPEVAMDCRRDQELLNKYANGAGYNTEHRNHFVDPGVFTNLISFHMIPAHGATYGFTVEGVEPEPLRVESAVAFEYAVLKPLRELNVFDHMNLKNYVEEWRNFITPSGASWQRSAFGDAAESLVALGRKELSWMKLPAIQPGVRRPQAINTNSENYPPKHRAARLTSDADARPSTASNQHNGLTNGLTP